MSFWYDHLLKPAFFQLDPERAHELGVAALRLFGSAPGVCRSMAPRARSGSRPIELFGLRFPNRVGMAAGFDKNAVCWRGLAALGFGHVEVGTVTYQCQPGNPRPRLFRFPEQAALINRMGFNNDGAKAVAARLARGPGPGRRPIPLGINIGKSKTASLEDAAADYLGSFALLADHADYFAINVSSPNTPDLRKLQEESRLERLLQSLCDANLARVRAGKPRRPMLLKIAPDLSFRQIDGILESVLRLGVDGLIATNTTLARPGYFSGVREDGGLSGAPVRRRSTEIISYIAKSTGGKLPIIGVGGVDDPASAGEKLDAGASLVQLYTGFIFRGPSLPRELARALDSHQRPWG
jgi:dihydroorotate dehydrogenase